jgi:hypothetical protein
LASKAKSISWDSPFKFEKHPVDKYGPAGLNIL